MNQAPGARLSKIIGFAVGAILIVGSLALTHLAYSDQKDAVEAKINDAQNACEISWTKGKRHFWRDMPCAAATDFANKIAGARITEGKSVSLTFRDKNGEIQNQTAFIDSRWLGEKTRSGQIPIVYRPGTMRPIRRPPNLVDFWPMAMLGSIGFIWIAIGLYRARVIQTKYEQGLVAPSINAMSRNGQKKQPGKIAAFIGLLAALATVYDSWAGHFSIGGFALGLFIVIIIYGCFALYVTKAMKHNRDVSETQRQVARRSLILIGATCLILVPTLLAFMVPP